MQENSVKEKLQTLIGFIENMEGLIKNPYTAGLKTEEMLRDIKNYVQEIVLDVDKLENKQSIESEPEKAE